MPGNEIAPAERLSYDIEQALQAAHDPDSVPEVSMEALASSGVAGVTAMYVECLLAIDSLPKTISGRRLGRTALSPQADKLLLITDQAIQLNPLYDTKLYEKHKMNLGYSLARAAEYSPPELVAKYYPETRLAALHNSVQEGFSVKPPIFRDWRSHTPELLVRAMRLAGSMDAGMRQALAEARGQSSYSTADYVATLADLAIQTSIFIKQGGRPKPAPPEQPTPLGKAILLTSSPLVAGGVLTESAMLVATGRPSFSAAVVGAVGGAVVSALNKKLR